MAEEFKTSDTVKNLIMYYEGFSPTPYFDYKQYSIGFGSGIDLFGQPVTALTPAINRRQAETLFEEVTLPIYEAGVSAVVLRVGLPVECLSALTSFAYNLGVNALQNSTLLARIELGQWEEVAYQWSKWVNVTPADAAISAALCKRRFHEYSVFKNALVASGQAFDSSFAASYPPASGTDSSRGLYITGDSDIYTKAGRDDFCGIVSRRSASLIDTTPWERNPTFDNNGDEDGQNPGPYYPNVGAAAIDAGEAASETAALRGITPTVIGGGERAGQAPNPGAGMSVTNQATTAGAVPTPPASGLAYTVLTGGLPTAVEGDSHPQPSPNPPAVKVASNASVLIEGKAVAVTLDSTSDGGIVGPGVPTVIRGI